MQAKSDCKGWVIDHHFPLSRSFSGRWMPNKTLQSNSFRATRIVMDETQVDSIAVNLLTPLIARLIGWASGVLLGGAGISLTVPGDAAGKIAIALVGLAGFVVHQLMAKAATVSNAKSAFQQGAAYVGTNVPMTMVPKVVSGSNPVMGIPITASAMAKARSDSIRGSYIPPENSMPPSPPPQTLAGPGTLLKKP